MSLFVLRTRALGKADLTSLARFVSPRKPTDSAGLFWGWNVRLATSISKVLSESPYAADGGYDLSIGTSERGTDIAEAAQEMGPFKCVSPRLRRLPI